MFLNTDPAGPMARSTENLLLIALCGCGGGTGPMDSIPVATVDIGATPNVVGLADTARFAATVRGASGVVLTGRAITWSTTDTSVLTVDAAGLATGHRSGAVDVVASVDGVSDTAVVSVRILFRSVAAGSGYTCAPTTAGPLFCWGANDQGQRGTGVPGDSAYPTAVGLAPAVVDVSTTRNRMAGGHTCARSQTVLVSCWGTGGSGELGAGSSSTSLIPVPVSAPLGATLFVAAGNMHSCAVATSGFAYCWGANSEGILGTGDTVWSAVPRAVAGGLRFVALGLGTYHSCGITVDQHAYCWGGNPAREYTIDTTGASLVPRLVSDSITFTYLTAGTYHTCGLTGFGTVYCWGGNSEGQLGTGDTVSTTTPVLVAGGHFFVGIAAGAYHTCAIDNQGGAYCWGYNQSERLGVPYSGSGIVLSPTLSPSPEYYVDISAGFDHTCALTVIGDIDCWGANSHGQLGAGAVPVGATHRRVVLP